MILGLCNARLCAQEAGESGITLLGSSQRFTMSGWLVLDDGLVFRRGGGGRDLSAEYGAHEHGRSGRASDLSRTAGRWSGMVVSFHWDSQPEETYAECGGASEAGAGAILSTAG